ncbi:uncharacterized protein LOC135823219 [Sycon ciliatum]|uniref:uncharacterized protein LOC135823219 n=1 Tax=Sycon ciliatum TaxID=27933 RepID=UPI0031F609E9
MPWRGVSTSGTVCWTLAPSFRGLSRGRSCHVVSRQRMDGRTAGAAAPCRAASSSSSSALRCAPATAHALPASGQPRQPADLDPNITDTAVNAQGVDNTIQQCYHHLVGMDHFRSCDVRSRRKLTEDLIKKTDRPVVVKRVIRQCSISPDVSSNSDIRALVTSALDHVAQMPPSTWVAESNHLELYRILYWASQCSCKTAAFETTLVQNLNVKWISSSDGLSEFAYRLFRLNMPNKMLAQRLVSRYFDFEAKPYSTLTLLLYCTLCDVKSTRLLDLLTDDFMNSKPNKLLLFQAHLLSDSSPLMDKYLTKAQEKAMQPFVRCGSPGKKGRLYRMMSSIVGQKYAGGCALVGGVTIQAFAIFDAACRPVDLQRDCPAELYDNFTIDMAAARRHRLSVVVCLGLSEKILLRHPARAPNGATVLEVLALKAQGCYVIPIYLEVGNRKQTKFNSVQGLDCNFPCHIPMFNKHLK